MINRNQKRNQQNGWEESLRTNQRKPQWLVLSATTEVRWHTRLRKVLYLLVCTELNKGTARLVLEKGESNGANNTESTDYYGRLKLIV